MDGDEDEQYLKKHNVEFFLNDSLSRLMSAQYDDKSLLFLSDYFDSVSLNSHVLLREYDYNSKITRNRTALIWHYENLFNNISDDCFSLVELHNWMLLICPDFPKSVFNYTYGIADFSQDKSIALIEWIIALKSYFIHLNYFEHLKACIDNNPPEQWLDHIENHESWKELNDVVKSDILQKYKKIIYAGPIVGHDSNHPDSQISFYKCELEKAAFYAIQKSLKSV